MDCSKYLFTSTTSKTVHIHVTFNIRSLLNKNIFRDCTLPLETRNVSIFPHKVLHSGLHCLNFPGVRWAPN